jgi:hypothetical protein
VKQSERRLSTPKPGKVPALLVPTVLVTLAALALAGCGSSGTSERVKLVV